MKKTKDGLEEVIEKAANWIEKNGSINDELSIYLEVGEDGNAKGQALHVDGVTEKVKTSYKTK